MAMSTPTPPHLRSLYRRLLRELPIAPSDTPTRTAHHKLSAASMIQQRLRQQFSSPSSTSPSPSSSTSTSSSSSSLLASQTAQAEQFLQYLSAQRMYTTLIERYNPGMGMSEEERVRLSARRIGMNLPVEFEGKK